VDPPRVLSRLRASCVLAFRRSFLLARVM
jgi:hypothetical protein